MTRRDTESAFTEDRVAYSVKESAGILGISRALRTSSLLGARFPLSGSVGASSHQKAAPSALLAQIADPSCI